jgi:hypothetical protein
MPLDEVAADETALAPALEPAPELGSIRQIFAQAEIPRLTASVREEQARREENLALRL